MEAGSLFFINSGFSMGRAEGGRRSDGFQFPLCRLQLEEKRCKAQIGYVFTTCTAFICNYGLIKCIFMKRPKFKAIYIYEKAQDMSTTKPLS
jgi:hypothetical protein